MLVNFIFSNYRSYLNENILSLQATKDSLYENTNTFSVHSSLLGVDENKLLKSAVIFGSNASGKTNLLKALRCMFSLIIASRVSDAGITSVDIEQYVFLRSKNLPRSKYEIDFIEKEVYYEYSFIIDENKVIEESFYKRTKGSSNRETKISTLFVRKGNLIVDGVYKDDINNNVEIKDQILTISTGKDMKMKFVDEFKVVYDFINSVEIRIDGKFDRDGLKFLEQNKDMAMKILNQSDIGLSDIEILDEKLDINVEDIASFDIEKIAKERKLRGLMVGQNKESKEVHRFDIITKFNVYDDNDQVIDQYEASLYGNSGFNSRGTEKLLNMIGIIIYALNNGGVLCIDEADAILHYNVAKFIIDLFNSTYNKTNAQLIITAYNPLLMESTLRKDQIYFVEKEKHGTSEVHSLAEFKNVRKEHCVYKRYLAGYYNAIPSINIDEF